VKCECNAYSQPGVHLFPAYSVSDAQREDVVTMLFQVWLLSISVVAVCWSFKVQYDLRTDSPISSQILNESIPHLVTTQAAHILLMAWSIYRICQSAMMEKEYKKFVLNDACRGADPLGNWWNVRLQHNVGPFSLLVNE
jgi:hypothetical protein